MRAWESFLAEQEKEIGKESVEKWLKTLHILKFDACNLYLEAKDTFQVLWFEEHMRQKVQAKLLNNNRKKIKVHLSLSNLPFLKKERLDRSKKSPSQVTSAFHLSFDTTDPTCTFENFIKTEANLLPFKFLIKTCGFGENSRPDLSSCNPIYLFGPSGSGKSHLLMGAYEHLKKIGYHVLYTRAETFTEHVVGAIRSGEMRFFRQAYRNIDILIMDDVHVFAKKSATQEEFFHTFNTLHMAGKQIILSAKCPPRELDHIEPRLMSRFEWGITLPLELPSKNDLRKILSIKAKALHHPIPQKIEDLLLELFTRNPKVLLRALEALILRHHLNQPNNPLAAPPLTPQLVRHYLADLIKEEEKESLTPQKVIQAVAEYFGIRSEDILGKAQTKECTFPRQLAMYFCRSLLKLPFIQIGDLFKKNHSTVMSSVKLITKQLQNNLSESLEAYRSISKKLSLK